MDAQETQSKLWAQYKDDVDKWFIDDHLHEGHNPMVYSYESRGKVEWMAKEWVQTYWESR